MAKLSDVFLNLLGNAARGVYQMTPPGMMAENRRRVAQEDALKQQELDNQRLSALTNFQKENEFTPIPNAGKPTNLSDLTTEMPQAPEGSIVQNVPGLGQGYVRPRPVFDPVQNKDGTWTHIERPKGGKTISYKPSSGNADRPRQTPYTDENGNPLLLGSDGTLTPATIPGGGKAVPFKGDESALGDANLIAQQSPNVDKLFDAYAAMKVPGQARLQSTGIGGFIDPATKQLEDSLKLTAFTFGGKNLTGQEKEVVFGALFPSIKDNDKSRELKRGLLKDFFAGKIDLLQAGNLLGSAGGTLRKMLAQKGGGGKQQPVLGSVKTVNSQADYDALPSGTQYYDSNGTLATKQ